jgi:hypothetical protein
MPLLLHLQVQVTDADLAQPSSDEDTSDEAYQAMHAIMAEEERKRFAALLAGESSAGCPLSTCLRVATSTYPAQELLPPRHLSVYEHKHGKMLKAKPPASMQVLQLVGLILRLSAYPPGH